MESTCWRIAFLLYHNSLTAALLIYLGREGGSTRSVKLCILFFFLERECMRGMERVYVGGREALTLIPDNSLPDTWYYFCTVCFPLRKKEKKTCNKLSLHLGTL
ncbi:UNVERIFIED_CONTAM: hypothetical protein K2H54_056799 [Gekko kuhli]